MYVNANSNHPPTITKQIPTSVQTRISSLSSNEEKFKTAAPVYNEALRNSGYHGDIKFTKNPAKNPKTKKRQRKVTWFNPPFSNNVKTNIGGKFINLIERHFPKGHKLHKIFNKSTVKISYCCMKNVNSIIKSHNEKVIRKSKEKGTPRKRHATAE